METERQRLRAVFDTNIFVAAHLSKNPHSPTLELLRRWRQEEFELLYSDDLLVEIDEKFSAKGIGDEYEGEYQGVKITEALPFLRVVRGNGLSP